MTIEIIVPLAGPDYVDIDGKIKGENSSGEVLFLREILMSRKWYNDETNFFIFVFRDHEATRRLYSEQIVNWFTNSNAVFLSHGTLGAALTTLSAVGNVSDFSSPLIIDLADIHYDCTTNPVDLLNNEDVHGVGLTFKSDLPIYSYLLFDEDGNFISSREKNRISTDASAGTYLFKSSLVFVKSLMKILEEYSEHEHNGLMYVCPVFNGLKSLNMYVRNFRVLNVVDVKV